MVLAACGKPTPPATATPTSEPAITATYTPTSAPTLAPITLGAFSAQLEGVGTNGTMACYTYGGDAKDLEGLTLTANISQGENRIERGIPSQQIDGKTCFEVVDAKYVSVNPADGTLVIPEDKISLEINATSPDGKPIQNNNQTLDLGKYVQFPFLGWIYQTDKACRANEHIGYMAWDFIPYPTSGYPTIVNTPVLSPADGYIYTIQGADATAGQNYSVVIYSPKTGYLIDLTHNAETFFNSDGKYNSILTLIGQVVKKGDIIAMIGSKDSDSGMPHTHMQILIPPNTVDTSINPSTLSAIFYDYLSKRIVPDIDFIKSGLFLDNTVNNYLANLPNILNACGNFPWGTLSPPAQQLPFTIDGKASDWQGYTPVLTDPAGDSQLGPVMDFTELYTAKDDNYLYFMVKMGQKPTIQYWFNLLLDTNSENQCGAADKILSFSPLDPTGFGFGNLIGCEEDSSNSKQYSGASFVAGDVLEGKIPLLYLGYPDKLDIVKIIGSIFADGRGSSPDTMP